jgi:hypothetical protein
MRVLKRISIGTVGLLACLVVLGLLYPVLDQYWLSNGRAYKWVLSFHATQGRPRHEASRLLYVSWFPDGHPKFARDCALYSDGLLLGDRIAWNRGVTGTGGWINETPLFHSLLSLPPLPAGLPNDRAVSCGRVLIVSRLQSGVWITRYYDREHLPPAIQQIVRLTVPEWRLHDPNSVYL